MVAEPSTSTFKPYVHEGFHFIPELEDYAYDRAQAPRRTSYTRGSSTNLIAYITCTNTLGNSLVFADQTPTPDAKTDMSPFAVPPGGWHRRRGHSCSLLMECVHLFTTSWCQMIRRCHHWRWGRDIPRSCSTDKSCR